jgi:glyoxylase-like metal-dependent hydrolase (beta-lactamase superfamily II)
MEIVRDVYQIRIPLPSVPLEYVNVYVVNGAEGAILIDTGWNTPEAFSALEFGLKGHGIAWKDIRQIVVTHIHPDHYGLAKKIREYSGAAVAMHRTEAGFIGPRYLNFGNLLEELGRDLYRNGVPSAELPGLEDASLWMNDFVMPLMPDVELDNGDRISNGTFEFEVMLTPGHSAGHICLYEARRKLLFSGDHILFEITPNVSYHPQSGDNPLGDYINSLETMAGLEVNLVFPGHGPVFNSLRIRVEEICSHHGQRERVIMKAASEEPKTVYQIAAEIPWIPDQGGVGFQNLEGMDRRLAIMETIAHLKLLLAEGRVREIERDGISFYLAK